MLVVVACSVARPTSAQEVLTETDVVRLARERAPGSQLANATVALAGAREETAGLLPNPSLGWERESLLTGEDSAQDVFRATLPIDVARPLSARSLAASRSAWMRAEASATRTSAVLDAVLAFYDAVAAERRIGILEATVASLDEASRVLARREEAGTASGYDTARLSIASELARSRLAEARGAARGARARLASFLGVDAARMRFDTSLAMATLPNEEELAQRAARRDLVTHARASARSAAEAEARAGWAFIPTLELSAGTNIVRDPDTRYGYVIGLSLRIPIFDHGQALRAEAQAQRALAIARTDALTRTVRSELESSYAAYTTAREELERFESATSDRVETLLRAAQSGYREGERTIVELLDAQRARTDVAERRLELLIAAKRAEARVRAAGGELR